ncbi:MAG TPA: PAS domain S-box protein [Verrucomicrobiae bacterium]|nr:PAS domain S-box protein [Verrucomicrobiae bacterium]
MPNLEEHPGIKRELALLAWIQQFAPYGIFTLDENLQVQSWNRWMESHSGLSGVEVIGKAIFDLFPEIAERKLTAHFQRALTGESSVLSTALHHYLLPLKSPISGRENDLMQQTGRIAPLLADGKVCGVIVVIEDVTQRENQASTLVRQHRRDEVLSWALVHLLKSEEPRKTVRQLFFKIAEHLDFDTFFLYLRDPASGAVTLYTAGGVTDDLQKGFVSYELLAGVAQETEPAIFNVVQNHHEPAYALLRAAKISSAVAIPLRITDKTLGALCFASWSREHIAPEETDLLGTIAQYLATAVDKENTNKELQRVEAANNWMGAIVASSDDAIISKDLDGIIKSCNEGAARLFGYEIPELVAQPMRMLIPDDHQNEETEILERIRSGQRLEHFETVRRRKDGRLIEVSMMVSPVVDATGKIIGASNIARDITERRQGEKNLDESFQREKMAREKAEAASRTKDNFLAALSHELRTPLNPALLIASESADNHELPEAVRLNFETIRKNIELEASLIDDLLDLTRITTGKMVLNKAPVDILEILTDAIATTQAEQQEKKLHLDIILNATNTRVEGDPVRLQQVFWNVLKNAVKFTPLHGKITLETSNPTPEHWQVTVTDTGIGMSADEVARVFTAFAQGDHAVGGGSHRFGGLGLGLAISRNLIEMHAGKITATSAGHNQGAVFTITLPLAKESKATTRAAPAKPAAPHVFQVAVTEMVVLLVEDHEVTRVVMAQLLRRRNYKVHTADSLAQARELAGQHKFDLLISDIGLPDGNGNDLMDELRQRYGLKGIALTGYGMEEDIARGKAAGFVTHLIKPVRIQALENALALLKA